GADVVGKPPELLVAIFEQREHEAADGVRRVAAIAEEAFERRKRPKRGVVAKRREQSAKRPDGEVGAANRLRERDEYRMGRHAPQARVEPLFPAIERRELF